MLLSEHYHVFLIFLYMQRILNVFSVIDYFSNTHIYQFDIGIRERKTSTKSNFFDIKNLGVMRRFF